MPATEPLIESTLADLTATSLEDLRSCEADLLRTAVSRLLDRIDDPDNRFGGYNTQRLH